MKNDPLNEGFRNHYYIGLAALSMGEPESARNAFNVSSRVKELKVTSAYHLAIVAMQEGSPRMAKLLNEAVEDGTVHQQIHSTLAVAHRKLGDSKSNQYK